MRSDGGALTPQRPPGWAEGRDVTTRDFSCKAVLSGLGGGGGWREETPEPARSPGLGATSPQPWPSARGVAQRVGRLDGSAPTGEGGQSSFYPSVERKGPLGASSWAALGAGKPVGRGISMGISTPWVKPSEIHKLLFAENPRFPQSDRKTAERPD